MRQLRQSNLKLISDEASAATSLYAADALARQWLAAVQGCPDLTPVAKVIATVIVCQEAAPDRSARWTLPQFCKALGMDTREVLGALADLAYNHRLDCFEGRWMLQHGSRGCHGPHP